MNRLVSELLYCDSTTQKWADKIPDVRRTLAKNAEEKARYVASNTQSCEMSRHSRVSSCSFLNAHTLQSLHTKKFKVSLADISCRIESAHELIHVCEH